MERESTSLWFIRLRWFAFAGQALVLALAVGVFDLSLPWERILALLFLIPASNLLALTRLSHLFPPGSMVGGLLVLDTFILTGVLLLAGGPTNPFTIAYLLHVVLGAVLLTPAWTWIVAALSSVGFALLFVFARPVPEWDMHGAHKGFSLHLHGMLLAYVSVAMLTALFLSRIARELQAKERRLERLENQEASRQVLAYLTTLTAGAAHEIGTPLSTIAVVARELERNLERGLSGKALLEDVAILRGETERCKRVLEEMAQRSGDLVGEPPTSITIAELFAEVGQPFSEQVSVSGELETTLHRVPRKALIRAMHSLVKNSIEASLDSGAKVRLSAQVTHAGVTIEVRDSGTGMDHETLERVGEPFFSRKSAGAGMGLGVYLAKLTFDQMGGKLDYASEPKRGTVARVSLPNSWIVENAKAA